MLQNNYFFFQYKNKSLLIKLNAVLFPLLNKLKIIHANYIKFIGFLNIFSFFYFVSFDLFINKNIGALHVTLHTSQLKTNGAQIINFKKKHR